MIILLLIGYYFWKRRQLYKENLTIVRQLEENISFVRMQITTDRRLLPDIKIELLEKTQLIEEEIESLLSQSHTLIKEQLTTNTFLQEIESITDQYQSAITTIADAKNIQADIADIKAHNI